MLWALRLFFEHISIKAEETTTVSETLAIRLRPQQSTFCKRLANVNAMLVIGHCFFRSVALPQRKRSKLTVFRSLPPSFAAHEKMIEQVIDRRGRPSSAAN
jgi:hypothetical protein